MRVLFNYLERMADLSSVMGRASYIQTALSLMELLRLCGSEYA